MSTQKIYAYKKVRTTSKAGTKLQQFAVYTIPKPAPIFNPIILERVKLGREILITSKEKVKFIQ